MAASSLGLHLGLHWALSPSLLSFLLCLYGTTRSPEDSCLNPCKQRSFGPASQAPSLCYLLRKASAFPLPNLSPGFAIGLFNPITKVPVHAAASRPNGP